MEEQVIYHPDFFAIPEGEGKPYLIAFHCAGCGKTWFPILPYCPSCWSNQFEKIALHTGKLYTYTVQNTPQAGVKAPLLFGFVDFPEEGVRVGAQIEVEAGKVKEQLKIGMEMQVIAGPIREEKGGKQVISYKFMPAV
ncbi:MAG: OB-fold domain-containing protein [Desulfotomaculaceae bacterium]|nr:OB-fold domain-containing protein [Desulfotomaculaceae bacterium]